MAREYHQGKYKPRHPEKYVGDVNNIVYRSGWELQLMTKFDLNPGVVMWNSEGLEIPYVSPVDGRRHRYFPDFIVRVCDKLGKTTTYILEIKPHAQTQLRTPKRHTKKFLTEVATFAVNQAKWHAATEFCKDQGWVFKVITERDHSFI